MVDFRNKAYMQETDPYVLLVDKPEAIARDLFDNGRDRLGAEHYISRILGYQMHTEIGPDTGVIPHWLESDQVEDWVASRAVKAVLTRNAMDAQQVEFIDEARAA